MNKRAKILFTSFCILSFAFLVAWAAADYSKLKRGHDIDEILSATEKRREADKLKRETEDAIRAASHGNESERRAAVKLMERSGYTPGQILTQRNHWETLDAARK